MISDGGDTNGSPMPGRGGGVLSRLVAAIKLPLVRLGKLPRRVVFTAIVIIFVLSAAGLGSLVLRQRNNFSKSAISYQPSDENKTFTEIDKKIHARDCDSALTLLDALAEDKNTARDKKAAEDKKVINRELAKVRRGECQVILADYAGAVENLSSGVKALKELNYTNNATRWQTALDRANLEVQIKTDVSRFKYDSPSKPPHGSEAGPVL